MIKNKILYNVIKFAIEKLIDSHFIIDHIDSVWITNIFFAYKRIYP